VLEALLADALRFQAQVELFDAPQSANLTVVCEGRASRTRAELGVDFAVTPYSQTAIAARLDCQTPHAQIARQWFAHGEILAFLPLNGPQGKSVAMVWSVFDKRVQSLLDADMDEFCQQLEISSEHCLGELGLISERRAWPLQAAQARRWVGRHEGQAWALAGDAAHSVHPLAGQGLNLGLSDAAGLALVLHQRDYWRKPGDEKLLRRYERSRKTEVLAMSLAMDGLQQLFLQRSATVQALRNWGMNGFERSGAIKQWFARQAMG
jgi:ubiquinone biosynthesis UbiH/UbiF/VisC/COQ6 family hydroxylase